MSTTEFNRELGALQQEQDRLQRERDHILMNPGNGTGGQAGTGGTLDVSKGGQYGGAAIAAALRGNEAGFDVRQANCDDVVKSGGNNPASIYIDTRSFGGSATLTFDLYGVKDRIAVISGGGVTFDSGCVANTGGSALSLSSFGQIRVIVEPNCDQTSSSAWEFRVLCLKSISLKK